MPCSVTKLRNQPKKGNVQSLKIFTCWKIEQTQAEFILCTITYMHMNIYTQIPVYTIHTYMHLRMHFYMYVYICIYDFLFKKEAEKRLLSDVHHVECQLLVTLKM